LTPSSKQPMNRYATESGIRERFLRPIFNAAIKRDINTVNKAKNTGTRITSAIQIPADISTAIQTKGYAKSVGWRCLRRLHGRFCYRLYGLGFRDRRHEHVFIYDYLVLLL